VRRSDDNTPRDQPRSRKPRQRNPTHLVGASPDLLRPSPYVSPFDTRPTEMRTSVRAPALRVRNSPGDRETPSGRATARRPPPRSQPASAGRSGR
jgi:hypothetical protein